MTNAVNLASAAGAGFAFRNRIINGDMRVSQRGSVNVTSGGGVVYSACDRFAVSNYFGSGQINTALSTTAPSGFTNSVSFTVATAAPLNGSTGYACSVSQVIEGYNIADCNGGTITLSFWVRSSVTGTYSVTFSNCSVISIANGSRIYVANYTINAANTWEYKTVTLSLSSGTSSGTWDTTNGAGLGVTWNLGAESNRKGDGALNNWQTMPFSGGYPLQSANQVNWASNSGATFYLTGVQLEVGSVATPFERRPYGLELALCQRYYTLLDFNVDGFHSFYGEGATNSASTFFAVKHQFPATMRATPTFVSTATFTTVLCSAVANLISSSSHVTQFGASNSANNRTYAHISSGKMTWSAEL